MKSIKSRFMASFLLVILLTATVLEFFIIISIKQYYISNIQMTLERQAELSADIYEQYLFNNGFYNLELLLREFSKYTSAEVQIIDKFGYLLKTTEKQTITHNKDYADIKMAISGKQGIWKGRISKTRERVLAVSYPLKTGDSVNGVVRYITSLEKVNSLILNAALAVLAYGTIVIILAVAVSIFLASTITNPVAQLTNAAKEIAAGRFKINVEKKYDDEIGKLAETMIFMSEEIMRQEELKTSFIASISHELRTPLTSIKGWAVTLRMDKGQYIDEWEEGLDIIEKESDRLSALVEELLDFSKFAGGKIKLDIKTIDVEQLVNKIINQIKPRAERQGVSCYIELIGELPYLSADENRLRQVMINLLDNALKFSNIGGKIGFIIKSCEEFISIAVEDDGCGIAEEHLPRIKQKFYKAKYNTPGSGLGLSISDEIVRLHNGKMLIESKEGEGTRVEILLPKHRQG